MYQSFINYQEEYDFYSSLLKKYKCQSLVEAGCGTGSLASLFVKNNFKYIGLDVSEAMLSTAREKNPNTHFINGDMRDFRLPEKVDACIIAGRTISYLLTNNDVTNTFHAITKSLKTEGIVCFDCIDADKFIPQIDPAKKIIHKASFKNKKYQRDSFWKLNPMERGAFDWASFYYEENESGQLIKIGEDNSTIRAFIKNEMVLFLQATGFVVKEIIDCPSYAFDTFVIVAQKI
jgi:SAM-dependent methyltransferase